MSSDRTLLTRLHVSLACTQTLFYFSFRSFRMIGEKKNSFFFFLPTSTTLRWWSINPPRFFLSPRLSRALDGLWRENGGSVNRLMFYIRLLQWSFMLVVRGGKSPDSSIMIWYSIRTLLKVKRRRRLILHRKQDLLAVKGLSPPTLPTVQCSSGYFLFISYSTIFSTHACMDCMNTRKFKGLRIREKLRQCQRSTWCAGARHFSHRRK